MRTDDLITALAADTRRLAPGAPARRIGVAAVVGGAVALAGVVAWLGLRPDLPAAVGTGFFWIKAAYTSALAVAFGWATLRLAAPETIARLPWLIGMAVIALFMALGLAQFLPMEDAARASALRGVSWTVCARNILILGAPLTLMSLAVLRGLAPTRPTLAGLSAGLFSGGLATTVYGLHCPEATFVFVALWYTIGIALCGVLGALIGRFWLRW